MSADKRSIPNTHTIHKFGQTRVIVVSLLLLINQSIYFKEKMGKGRKNKPKKNFAEKRREKQKVRLYYHRIEK